MTQLNPQLEGILGLIGYKVGMATAIVKDSTDKSMTAGKKISVPVTLLEIPPMKVFSIRFYKENKPIKEIIVSHDKELKRKLKVPKKIGSLDNIPTEYDDIRIIVYSMPKETSVKKTPDIIELAIKAKDKLEFVKSIMHKELSLTDFLKVNLVDVRGLTKGKGLVGPLKRFGLGLKQHKSEKGRRRPGSLGPWHPAHVTFRVPMAGQMGLFTRVHYNQLILNSGKIKEKDINNKSGFKYYGKIKTSYLMIVGSIQGPPKRQILITPAFRPTRYQAKKKYEFLELVTKTP